MLTTADLLAALLLTAALTAFLEQRYRLLAACLALAGLTHETMLATIGALALPLLLRRRFRAVGWLALGSLPVLAWNAFVLWYLPPSGSTTGLFENFSWPGQGVVAKLSALAGGPFSVKWAYDAAAWVLLSLSLLRLTWLASTRSALHFLAPSAWVYLVLFLTSRMQIHGYHLDYLRVFAPGVLLLSLTARRPASARWTGIWMAAWGLCSLAFLLAYSTGRI
ncbi:MAG: hypothetical protein K9N49_09615 [Candidatus Marinimicrobia bacterium]|nr:hypothetical protein [Candidatus Neomarinimicrobiota bacterium]